MSNEQSKFGQLCQGPFNKRAGGTVRPTDWIVQPTKERPQRHAHALCIGIQTCHGCRPKTAQTSTVGLLLCRFRPLLSEHPRLCSRATLAGSRPRRNTLHRMRPPPYATARPNACLYPGRRVLEYHRSADSGSGGLRVLNMAKQCNEEGGGPSQVD
jgi:hypothetical protein